jgi:hypothetical protein
MAAFDHLLTILWAMPYLSTIYGNVNVFFKASKATFLKNVV